MSIRFDLFTRNGTAAVHKLSLIQTTKWELNTPGNPGTVHRIALSAITMIAIIDRRHHSLILIRTEKGIKIGLNMTLCSPLRALTTAVLIGSISVSSAAVAGDTGLWQVYNDSLKSAKYVDMTHTITPDIPVWIGFGGPTFAPASAGIDIEGYASKGETFTYTKHGFEANSYTLRTDQLGTQLDPPAHWAPDYPAIDELPATYTIRPLVVISIEDQVKKDYGYALQVSDIEAFEKEHDKLPEGSVVFVRSGWSKEWPNPGLAKRHPFPGVSLAALKFLHQERHILFHGHEPLDTDSTPNLEGEAWLMHNGYAQAEGVTNLDKVPPVGALVAIGYPKFGGGLGGYARYVAICPPDWPFGVSVGEVAEAPLPKFDKPLRFDATRGMRVRD